MNATTPPVPTDAPAMAAPRARRDATAMTHVLLLSARADAPSRLLALDPQGRVLSRTLLSGASAAPAAGRLVAVVPGTAASAFWFELPARNPRQAHAAARALLEPQVAGRADALHVAVADVASDDGRRCVIAVERDAMQGWLQRIAALGLRADALLPDHLALPAGGGARVRVIADGEDWIARDEALAFRAEAALASLVLEDRELERIDDPQAADALLAQGARASTIDLLQGEFALAPAQAIGWRAHRRLALLAAAALVSPLLLWAGEALHWTWSARALEAQAEQRANALLPGRAPGESALAAVRTEYADLRAQSRLPTMVAALADGVRGIDGAEVDALSYDRDGVLRATLGHRDGADLAPLRAAAAAAGYAFQVAGVRRADGRVASDVQIAPAEAVP